MKEQLKQWLMRLFHTQDSAHGALDGTGVDVQVTHWRVTKYDGDPPRPDEDKVPVEIIQGGDGIPTRIWRRIGGKMVEVTDNDPS